MGKKKIFLFGYNVIYPWLISSVTWKGDYVFFQEKKKIMENNFLEKLWDKIVDAIYKTFTGKYYFAKISQSKNGQTYLIKWKKRGRLIDEEKQALHKKIFDVSNSVLNWCCQKK